MASSTNGIPPDQAQRLRVLVARYGQAAHMDGFVRGQADAGESDAGSERRAAAKAKRARAKLVDAIASLTNDTAPARGCRGGPQRARAPKETP